MYWYFYSLLIILVGTIWFGLVSLFNGMSTFLGYLMPKPFSEKNSSGTILTHIWEDKGVHTFSQGYLPESERNNSTEVQTRLLRFRSPSL